MPLIGDTILLREEREEDLPLLVELRNDLETQAWSKTLPPDYTLPMYLKRFQDRPFSYNRTDGRFIIVFKSSGEAVGTILYSELESRWSTSVGIMVAKKFWSAGVAYEAQELLLSFLFQELGLRVVRLWTHSGNPRAVRLAERSGFKVSLRYRSSVFKNGRFFDSLSMDLLRPEYFSLHPELTDTLPPLG